MICENVTTDQALALGERLAAAARVPIDAGGVEHRFSASVGIAFSEGDPPEADALARAADAAAYRAKRGSGVMCSSCRSHSRAPRPESLVSAGG